VNKSVQTSKKGNDGNFGNDISEFSVTSKIVHQEKNNVKEI